MPDKSVSRIDAAKDTVVGGDLFFKGNTPRGNIFDLLGYVEVEPTGGWNQISSEVNTLQFNYEFLANRGYGTAGEPLEAYYRGKAS
jgi:hypothetical protein